LREAIVAAVRSPPSGRTLAEPRPAASLLEGNNPA
jgi:hypothetical protein